MSPKAGNPRHCRFVPCLVWAACLLCAGASTPLRAQALLPAVISAAVDPSLPDAPSSLLATTAPAAGQTPTEPRCRITGVVSDIQGGLIPGAHVRATREGADAAELRTTDADQNGHFVFTDLPAGVYTVTIASPGFETYNLKDVRLKPGEAYELPEVALPIARTTADATVTLTEEQLADAEINDELHQRVLGILPNYFTSYIWDAAPLNTRQKWRLTWKSATDPVFFATTAITAGIQYANNTYPSYGDGAQGYFTRYAAAYGDALVGRTITSVFADTLFHQDPRYFVMTNGHWYRRAWHAVDSTFLARGDDKKWHFAYGHFVGTTAAACITYTYHQQDEDLGVHILSDVVYSLGEQAIRNLAREFIFRHLALHVPSYAKGKPPEED